MIPIHAIMEESSTASESQRSSTQVVVSVPTISNNGGISGTPTEVQYAEVDGGVPQGYVVTKLVNN